MRLIDLIENIELSFPKYSVIFEVKDNNRILAGKNFIMFDVTTPLDLVDYPALINDDEIEISEIRGLIKRALKIEFRFIDILEGYSDFVAEDTIQAVEIEECSDSRIDLRDLSQEIESAILDGKLPHDVEGLEVRVNIIRLED